MDGPRSKGAWSLLALALALAGVACRTSDPAPSQSAVVPRLGLVVAPRARLEHETEPTPLTYGGGFLNKTLVFETLTRVDRCGRLLPGLARSWSSSADGSDWTFELRPGARFHGGAPCDAEAVRTHVLRWLGDADDAFIRAATCIDAVEVVGPRTVRFRLSEPLDLPYDLAIVNPMAIVGPGAERGQATPVLDGTGPFRIAEFEPMRRFRLERNDAYDGELPVSPALELVLFPAASPRDAIGLWALRRGKIDALIEDWIPKIPRAGAVAMLGDGEFVLERTGGSATLLLAFNAARAPFDDVAWRRRVAGAVDREALVRQIEVGLGAPSTTLFAPGVLPWPHRAAAAAADAAPPSERVGAQILVAESDPELIRAAVQVADDLRAAGVDLELDFVDGKEHARRLWAGEFDLAFAWTWGVPYDPQTTLHARFGPQPDARTAVESPPLFQSPELARLVLAYGQATTLGGKGRIAEEIQSFVEREAAVVPLYVPDRIALRRRELTGLSLDVHGYEIDVTHLCLDAPASAPPP